MFQSSTDFPLVNYMVPISPSDSGRRKGASLLRQKCNEKDLMFL